MKIGPLHSGMDEPIYPDERREASIQATLYNYLQDTYDSEVEYPLGERGLLG